MLPAVSQALRRGVRCYCHAKDFPFVLKTLLTLSFKVKPQRTNGVIKGFASDYLCPQLWALIDPASLFVSVKLCWQNPSSALKQQEEMNRPSSEPKCSAPLPFATLIPVLLYVTNTVQRDEWRKGKRRLEGWGGKDSRDKTWEKDKNSWIKAATGWETCTRLQFTRCYLCLI